MSYDMQKPRRESAWMMVLVFGVMLVGTILMLRYAHTRDLEFEQYRASLSAVAPSMDCPQIN